ncbi:hypothetical protein TNCV_4287721 [Trichonephila clavipes]|uniref:Uncharacterized protein n=1 Tax=Trichonephila clavipes TaxID=2585209 RepID=A0A8X6SG76_TRICX|nr:hypothetical protein TNCV_4287721 [Trichonephila clavipes]
MGAAISNALQPGAFTGASSEEATCDWKAADEAVGCTRAFLMMWRSSRQLVCRGHPEPGLRVKDISDPLVTTPLHNANSAA